MQGMQCHEVLVSHAPLQTDIRGPLPGCEWLFDCELEAKQTFGAAILVVYKPNAGTIGEHQRGREEERETGRERKNDNCLH